jgi:hypothetical protein
MLPAGRMYNPTVVWVPKLHLHGLGHPSVRSGGGGTLVDDARTVTPLPAADAGVQGSIGDVRASTSPPVIDMDPINMVHSTSEQDLVGDPIQIEQVPKNPETSGA